MNCKNKICLCMIIAALLTLFVFTAAAEAFNASVVSDKMSIHASSDASSAVIGTLSKGKEIVVVSYSGNAAYIEYNGNYGYVSVSDLKKTGDAIGTATVTTDKLKVYASASTDSKVLCTLKSGKTYTLVTKNNAWAKIQNGNTIGYVKLAGVKVTLKENAVTAAPTVAPTVSTTPAPTQNTGIDWAVKSAWPKAGSVSVSSMTVRKGPTADDEKLGTLKSGTVVAVHAVNNGIAFIEYNGKGGFCRASDLKISNPYKTAVSSTAITVYESASSSSKVIGSAKKGYTFTLVDYDSNWAKIQNGDRMGYTPLSGLTLMTVSATATPAPTATPVPTISASTNIAVFANVKTNVYKEASTSSAVSYTLSAGAECNILGYSGSWALVSASNGKGYAPLSAFTKVSDVTITATTSVSATVSDSSLKFYKYASTTTKYLGTLSKGTSVTLLGNDGTWAFVSYKGNKGYCKLSGLKVVEKPTLPQNESIHAVTNKSAKMYTYAINTSDLKTTVSAGTEVTVLGHNDAWALIKTSSATGYVARDAVTNVSEVTLTANENYTATVKTAGSVYTYMLTSSKTLGSLTKNMTVNVIAEGSGWALIQKGSNKGYVPANTLNIIRDEFVNPTTCNTDATVISKTTVYQLAIETSSKLTTFGLGRGVTMTAYTTKWAKVTDGTTTGYVLKSALSTDSYSEMKSGTSSGSNVTKLQKRLEDLGYFDGIPAGNYGSLTLTAVKRFEAELGITEDGVADVDLLRVLYSTNAPESPIRSKSLSVGSVGSDVTRLQTRLTYKGYMSGSVDGDYGNITKNAVTAYQKKAGLSQTGVADTATLKSLFSSSAPTNPTTNTGGGTASTGNYSTNPDDDPAAGTASEKIELVIATALQQLGKPYIYGTSGTSSYDCSGLTCYCYKKVGISLGRSAYAQGYNNVGTKIEGVNNLKRGDLVCLNTLSDNDLSDHVGIYLGGGKFVHASSSAAKVIISPITSGYYYRVFSWGRRLL